MARYAAALVDLLARESEWTPVLDMGAARFSRHGLYPDCYRRQRVRNDGSIETRYACDDVVVPGLVELAARYVESINAR